MKKLIFIISIVLSSFTINSNPIVPADTMRIDGKLVLWLMVDGYEAGYAYGSLLGNPIVDVLENYIINHTFGGATNYQYARQLFDEKFIYDAKYEQIAQGMIEGIQDADISIYSPTLGEELTFKDILIANSIPDFTAFSDFNITGPGCSDLMSWGDATANSELGGELVISRNLDWESNPYLINNSLIIIWGSMSGANQRIITFGFTGLIGALSGINESGMVTFQNMGNHNMAPVGTDFYPVNLAQRNGLESWDYNDDGENTPRDISDAVRAHNVSSTFIINSAGPNSEEYPAEILEIHNQIGEAIRTVDNNFTDFNDNLFSTNHFRKLMPPVYCWRYTKMSDSLNYSDQMSISRNWSVLQAAGVSTNLQTIQYIPYMHKLRFSFAEIGTPAYQIEPTEVDLDTLFTLVGLREPANNDFLLFDVFPNPSQDFTTIRFISPVQSSYICRIFNSKGQVIFKYVSSTNPNEETEIGWGTDKINPGIYFCNIEFRDRITKSFQTETRKIVVSR
jgi:hypothetical protein